LAVREGERGRLHDDHWFHLPLKRHEGEPTLRANIEQVQRREEGTSRRLVGREDIVTGVLGSGLLASRWVLTFVLKLQGYRVVKKGAE